MQFSKTKTHENKLRLCQVVYWLCLNSEFDQSGSFEKRLFCSAFPFFKPSTVTVRTNRTCRDLIDFLINIREAFL